VFGGRGGGPAADPKTFQEVEGVRLFVYGDEEAEKPKI
jgi:hypothetical protein